VLPDELKEAYRKEEDKGALAGVETQWKLLWVMGNK